MKCRKKAGHPLKIGGSGNEGRPDQSAIFLEAQAIMERKKRGEDVPSMAPRSMSAGMYLRKRVREKKTNKQTHFSNKQKR